MNRGLVLLLALAVFIGISTQKANAGVPQMINYQGTLTNANGAAVANGNYNIEFKIYSVASGGTALWSEKWDTTTSQVPVVGGVFNVMLGYRVPIPENFFANYPVTYLSIKVGTDSEMLPRQRVTSVGYAFSAGNGVPKGGVIMWSGAVDQIPAGWALCDGVERTLSDGSKITPPNLKDRFIMGAGGGYAVGASGGEATHILTVNEMPTHSHGVADPGHQHAYKNGSDTTSAGYAANTNNGQPSQYTENATTGISINNVGGGNAHNNLPPYYALAFIMKL